MYKMIDCFSEEKNETGKPLLSGVLLDLNEWPEDDLEETRVHQIKQSVRALANKFKTYKEPYIIMDLIERNQITLYDSEGGVIPHKTPNILRVVVSASEMVDLNAISNTGNSVVKVNAAVPIYRWFQAANLLLKTSDVTGRVVPFPLEQEKGEMVYHMLRVTPSEYMAYQQVLEFSQTQYASLETAFAVSAKMSYEILKQRGITELNVRQVDHTLTHVVLKNDCTVFGVILENSTINDVDAQNLKINSIFF